MQSTRYASSRRLSPSVYVRLDTPMKGMLTAMEEEPSVSSQVFSLFPCSPECSDMTSSDIPPPFSPSCNARSFQALELAFSYAGGISSEGDLLQRLQMFCDQPISKLAHWIVDREIVHFTWQGRTFVPMFQFLPTTLRIRDEARSVIFELASTLDDWELVTWFATPSPSLKNRAPVDLLSSNFPEVLNAARFDRYLSRG